jgi:ATP-dependent RNA helicase SUPV3L1/SUV3
MDLFNITSIYKELLLPYYMDKLKPKTLTELGCKSSSEASNANNICIREYSHGMRSIAGLWVNQDDENLIRECIREIDSERTAKAERKVELEATKEIRLKKSNISTAIREISLLTGLTHQEVRKALPESCVNVFGNSPKEAAKVLAMHLAPMWRDQALSGNNYLLNGIKISANSKDLCIALLEKDHDSYINQLNIILSDKLIIIKTLKSNWTNSKPNWFSDELLDKWAVMACNGQCAEHPLSSLKELSKLKSKQIRVEVQPALIIHSDFDYVAALDLLWKSPSIEENSPSTELINIARNLVKENVVVALNKFVNLNAFTTECARNEYTKDEWQLTLEHTFYKSLSKEYFTQDKAVLDAQSKLSSVLNNRHLVLAAKRCRSELPTDLKDFYPLARKIEREIVFYYGPTNSGKTHRALDELKSANTGVYLGPLRLLALEVFERLNSSGTPTDLVTGEATEEIFGAQHTSATIEMLNLGKSIDVAVIDEVQMLSDPDRGSAWLQAVLGVPAKKVVLLGSVSALSAVRMLANQTGEKLVEVCLERLNPLAVSDHCISLKDAPNGSALIVFSRKNVLSLANHLRLKYDRKVSVIYGSLSPEVRAEQARQFREGESDILVSTDAIGMGLNLPIRTVIFTTSTKWNGESENLLGHALTNQIAGRAGRFGMHDAGMVTALDRETLKYVKKMLSKETSQIYPPYSTGLNLEMADSISRHLETDSLGQVIAFFKESMQMHHWSIPNCSNEQVLLAGYLDRFDLSLRDKLILSNAPAIYKGTLSPYFDSMIRSVIEGTVRDAPVLLIPIHGSLESMEVRVKNVTLYSWMHYRYPKLFPLIDEAKQLLNKLNIEITNSLASATGKICIECDRPLPWDHTFGKCESCFGSKNRYYENYGYFN